MFRAKIPSEGEVFFQLDGQRLIYSIEIDQQDVCDISPGLV